MELRWGMGKKETGDRFRQTHEYRLELTPGRRFRYRWRSTEESPESWKEIAGNWRPLGARKWALEPDLGRASLKVGEFDEGEFPVLEWSTSLSAVEPGSPDLSGGMYMIPAVDPETGLFLDADLLQQDPRYQRR